MKNLSDLLNRLSKIINKDELLKGEVLNTIETLAKIRLNSEQIHVKEGVLEINSSPGVNNAIALKESEILVSFKEKKIFISRILYKS